MIPPPMREDTAAARVLVIDDEDVVRDVMCDMLEAEGMPCLSVGNGAAGVALVERHGDGIGLVILDLMMPVMGGLTFLKKLRKDPLYTGLPVFVLTGKAISEDECALLDELASAALFKEDAPEQLGEPPGSKFSLAAAQG